VNRSFRGSTWLLIPAVGVLLAACTCLPKGRADLDVGMKERGIASWYGEDFHGWMTASGEIYNMEALTGAHRTLPLGTVVRVTNVKNGKQVRVRINDRGPYVHGRILDLSYAAARKLNMVEHGITTISLEVIGNQAMGSFLLSEEAGTVPWQFWPLGAGGEDETGAGTRRLHRSPAPDEARAERNLPLFPGDVMRERRARRVSDILAAEHRVYHVATLHLI
jgi:rare lipoprotein A